MCVHSSVLRNMCKESHLCFGLNNKIYVITAV